MKKVKAHQCFTGLVEFWQHYSQTTQTNMSFSLYRPAKGKQITGGLIWLSGLTCTEENFLAKAGALRLMSELGLALICPDTSPRGLELPAEHDSYDFGSGASFYLDAQTDHYKEHYKMYSYINEEIYDFFNNEFNLKGNIGIFGHSMGGHGALTIGLKNPTKYKSISAFSPIANPALCDWGKKAFRGFLGENESLWQEHDACALVYDKKNHPQSILIDQGLSDEFYPQQLLTENFKNACHASGQKACINYHREFDHSYYFISTFIDEHIRHHRNSFI